MNDMIRYPQAGRTWLPFAELSLPQEAFDGDPVEAWLKEALQPLGLPVDFTGKVLASARDSIACIPPRTGQARLLVLTALPRPAHAETWGFFRTVKNATIPGSPPVSVHEIAFYLYVEGKPRPEAAKPD